MERQGMGLGCGLNLYGLTEGEKWRVCMFAAMSFRIV